MSQTVTFDVQEVRLYTGAAIHRDRLTLVVKNEEFLTKVVGEHSAKNHYEGELQVEIWVTAGCGEKLAAELGVKIDEIVKV